jgi:hypothetical protein
MTVVMGYLGLRDVHSVHFPNDVVPAERSRDTEKKALELHTINSHAK